MNKQELKAILLEWFKSQGAIDVRELEPEEGYADQIHGWINNRYFVAFFRDDKVTFTAFGKSYYYFTVEEFKNGLENISFERTLERAELLDGQYIKTELDLEDGVIKTYWSLMSKN